VETQVLIAPFHQHFIPQVKEFTDRWIGANYYSLQDLEETYQFSLKAGLNASFIAFKGDDIAAIRLTYAPGNWLKKTQGMTPEKWKCQQEKVGYFKSLFVSQDYQSQGIGSALSKKSIEVLKEMGAKGIICHSWLESPENSSQKYLSKMGFYKIKDHPYFWHAVDYECTRCKINRCVCTAQEMLKEIG